jgi:hypothetical protein
MLRALRRDACRSFTDYVGHVFDRVANFAPSFTKSFLGTTGGLVVPGFLDQFRIVGGSPNLFFHITFRSLELSFDFVFVQYAHFVSPKLIRTSLSQWLRLVPASNSSRVF